MTEMQWGNGAGYHSVQWACHNGLTQADAARLLAGRYAGSSIGNSTEHPSILAMRSAHGVARQRPPRTQCGETTSFQSTCILFHGGSIKSQYEMFYGQPCLDFSSSLLRACQPRLTFLFYVSSSLSSAVELVLPAPDHTLHTTLALPLVCQPST
ncbi:hypothetical protein MAPG_00397 [Magnaporthiopsis poae ATCC 64411]|uniref:Uncharacterized protein n=1 Tax=Magnaporthiopsis poae (strain ATCC 64411 / 73-15) TaxID=644358 RepID=A0A0C4DKW5_MAGP6|nr:hypothetical protein MAPG_00397 [Magnaporthiopsis poae ATCC 64411]